VRVEKGKTNITFFSYVKELKLAKPSGKIKRNERGEKNHKI
jgi:hypothetical protein